MTLSPATPFLLPLIKVVLWGTGLVVLGWKGSNFLNNIRNDIQATGSQINSLRSEVSAQINAIRVDMQSQMTDRWTRTDMRFYGYELRSINDGKVQVPRIEEKSFTTPTP